MKIIEHLECDTHSRRRMLRIATALTIAALGLWIQGCATPPEQPRTIANADLDLQIVDLPESWTVKVNQGRDLVLAPSAEGAQGKVVITVSEDASPVNLIEAVHKHQAAIEARDHGEYKGANELGGGASPAYYSRGRYSDHGTMVEETAIFTLHPRSGHLMTLRYDYPAGDDSGARVTDLIGVLSAIE